MDRPDGAGGGTPTVVTSRAADDDLTGNDQGTRPNGVMAPPRRPSPVPTAATSASGDTAPPDDAVSAGTAGSGISPNGTSATAKDAPSNGGPAKDAARPDDTAVDAVPALPADTIGSPVADPAPPAAHQTAADAAMPSEREPSPSSPPSPGPSGSASSGAVPSGRPSSAGQPAVSPAAFAWEMPGPPPDSSSSPAGGFLRSGLGLKASVAKAGLSGGAGQDPATEDPAAGPGPGRKNSSPEAPSPTSPSAKAQARRTARQAHLTVARVEPWSVMKFSFVVSLVAFVILFVAVSVLYAVLSAVGVFDSLQHVVTSLTSSQGSPGVDAKTWFSASRVLGYTALLGSLNIVLITAMCTIGAVVYNLTSRLVGGVEVTLRETD